MGRRLDSMPEGRSAPLVPDLDLRTNLVCRFRPDATLVHVNEAYARCLGLARDELIGRALFSVLPEAQRESLRAHLQSLLSHPRIATRLHQATLPDGTHHWQAWIDQPILSDDDQVIEVQSVGQTLEQAPGAIQTQSLVANPEAPFLKVCDSIDDLFWLRDCRENRVIWASSAYERIWGRRLKDLYTDPSDWVLACVPQDRRRVAAALENDPAHLHEVYRIQAADGSERWIEDRCFPILNETGEPCKVVGIAQDITRRKRAERRLEQSEKLLRTTLDALPACIAALDQGARVVMVNAGWRAFVDQIGSAVVDYGVGSDYLDTFETAFAVGPDVLAAVRTGLQEVLAGRRKEYVCDFVSSAANRKRWFEARVSACDDDGIRFAVVTHRDVTERVLSSEKFRRQEAELAHIGRVAMMAEVSAGFSHELNQPLATIINYCEGCLARLEQGSLKPDELSAALLRARDLAAHAGEVIRSMRRAVKKTPPHQSSVAIHAVVREVVDLLQYELESRGIALLLELDDSVPLLLADSVRLQQVLLNLVLNAMAAVADAPAAKRRITIATRKEGGAIRVSVRDRGPGLSAEAEQRLFEPFYTTKPNGLGMGLVISRSIVEEHGGRLWPERRGDETVFSFTIPFDCRTIR